MMARDTLFTKMKPQLTPGMTSRSPIYAPYETRRAKAITILFSGARTVRVLQESLTAVSCRIRMAVLTVFPEWLKDGLLSSSFGKDYKRESKSDTLNNSGTVRVKL